MPIRFSTAVSRFNAVAAVDAAVVGRPLASTASLGIVASPLGVDGASPLGVPTVETGGGLFLLDTMTGAAGTDLALHPGELGATWARHAARPSGQVVLTAQNRVRHAGTPEAVYVAAGAPPTPAYDVVGNLYVAALPTAAMVAMVLARVDVSTSNWYGFGYDASIASWAIVRQTGAARTVLASVLASLQVGRTYEVTAEVRDGAKRLLVDGTPVCTTADNAQAIAGRVGLLAVGAGPTGADTNGLHWADVLGRPA